MRQFLHLPIRHESHIRNPEDGGSTTSETSVSNQYITQYDNPENYDLFCVVFSRQWTIGVLGFNSRPGLGILLFTTSSSPALGPIQSPIQWVPGSFSLGVRRPGRKADHSPPSSAEVKDWVQIYIHSPNTPSWRGVQLKKHRAVKCRSGWSAPPTCFLYNLKNELYWNVFETDVLKSISLPLPV
jgi:hypothetical protein